MTAYAMGFATVSVAMVNGIRGAARDPQNDRCGGVKTTALLLRARGALDDAVVLLNAAASMQVVLCALLLVPLMAGVFGYGAMKLTLSAATVVGLLIVSTAALVRAYRMGGPPHSAMACGTWHPFLTLAALLAAYAWRLPPWAAGVAVVCFLLPPKLFEFAVHGTEFGLPLALGFHRAAPTNGLSTRLRGHSRS